MSNYHVSLNPLKYFHYPWFCTLNPRTSFFELWLLLKNFVVRQRTAEKSTTSHRSTKGNLILRAQKDMFQWNACFSLDLASIISVIHIQTNHVNDRICRLFIGFCEFVVLLQATQLCYYITFFLSLKSEWNGWNISTFLQKRMNVVSTSEWFCCFFYFELTAILTAWSNSVYHPISSTVCHIFQLHSVFVEFHFIYKYCGIAPLAIFLSFNRDTTNNVCICVFFCFCIVRPHKKSLVVQCVSSILQ